jgi:hypothetical protein
MMTSDSWQAENINQYDCNKNSKKVTHFSNTSAGSLVSDATESKEPAISRTYAKINKKKKVSGLKIILTVFSFSENS